MTRPCFAGLPFTPPSEEGSLTLTAQSAESHARGFFKFTQSDFCFGVKNDEKEDPFEGKLCPRRCKR